MSYKSWAKAQIPNKIHTTEVYWDKTNYPIRPGTVVILIAEPHRYKNGIVITKEEAAKRWGFETTKGYYGKDTVWVMWPNGSILQSHVNELTKK